MKNILKKIISKFNKDLGKIRGNNFTNKKLIVKFIKDFNSKSLKQIKDKIVCFDFDGVIATYKGFKGIDVFGQPIPNTIKATQKLKEKGYYIIIFTTRLETPALKKWLLDNKVAYNEINKYKNQPPNTSFKPIWHCYIGDRTFHFDTKMKWCNTEIIVKAVEKIVKETKEKK